MTSFLFNNKTYALFFYLICDLLFAVSLYADPLESALKQAESLKLYEERFWHLLLHYRPSLTGYVSEADGDAFFLASTGKTDPKAELFATITAFFKNQNIEATDMIAQCQFPARYTWLKSKLDLGDELDWPCERFTLWRDTINAGSASLIFADAYLNAPASMYGHTLIKLGRKHMPDSNLLAYTFNYAADVTTNNPILYAIYGLGGGFKGKFTVMPYYTKIQEYSNIESRDLWAYELNFSQSQIDWIIMHAWELGSTHFDYFFFSENCSYHLLSLLEIADETLHLRDQFSWWTIPFDTVRSVLNVPHLITKRTFRPSYLRIINARRQLLNHKEIGIATCLVLKEDAEIQEDCLVPLELLRPERQALVLDAAYDYFKYEHGFYDPTDPQIDPVDQARERMLLVKRGQLGIASPPLILPEKAVPESGHETMRLGIGLGFRPNGEEPFQEISLRPALHDLLDSPFGYEAEGGEHQLEMFSLRLRVQPESLHDGSKDGILIDRLDLVNIFSLSPLKGWVKRPSWQVSFGLNQAKDLGCLSWDCLYFGIEGGPGIALSSHLLRGETYYIFSNLNLGTGAAFDDFYRIGIGPSAGMLVQITSFWRFLLQGEYRYDVLGDRGAGDRNFHLEIGQSLSINTTWNLRWIGTQEGTYQAVSLLSYFYF